MSKRINYVCDDCGKLANRLTCLKKYGQEPTKIKFHCSTYHQGVCDYCGKSKPITEVRDFFYPDFSLIKEKEKWLKKFMKDGFDCQNCFWKHGEEYCEDCVEGSKWEKRK